MNNEKLEAGLASDLNRELDALPTEQRTAIAIIALTAQLMKFYQVTDINDLVKAQCDHIERLQAQAPKRDLPLPIYQKVRFA